MLRLNEEFTRESIIGIGGNGTVWKAINKLDDKVYALKIVYYDGEPDQKSLREIKILSDLKHENIVRYFSSWKEIHPPEITGALRHKTCLIQCIELCEEGDLYKWMTNHRSTTDLNVLRQTFTQIVLGVAHLHDKNIMHRDLKPSNIYVKREGPNIFKLKIGDFGFSKKIFIGDSDSMDVDIDPHTNLVGTKLYWSPELRNRELYNQSVDIFPMGLIYFELLYGETVRMDSRRKKILFKGVKDGLFPSSFQEHFPSEIPFINSMLVNNPADRITANNILIRLLPYNKDLSAQVSTIVDHLKPQ